MRKLFLIIIVVVGIGDYLHAQDPIFSQFYATPLQLNPAFAGSGIAPRMGAAYRNQWSGFNNAYRTFGLFYEQPLQRLNSGIGFSLESDDAGQGIYKTNRFHGVYAYNLRLREDVAIKLGLEAGFYQNSLDWTKLLFPDQIDALGGIAVNTDEITPELNGRVRLDMGAGMLVLGDNFHAGFSLKHINTPNDALLLTNDNLSRGLPIRYTIQGGFELNVKKGNKNQAASFISPNFLFVSQGPYRQLNVGAFVSAGFFYGGAWYRHTFRNADAAIFTVGFQQGVVKVGLSYDATISGLSGRSGGTFELTTGLLLDKSERLRERNKRSRTKECPRMFQ